MELGVNCLNSIITREPSVKVFLRPNRNGTGWVGRWDLCVWELEERSSFWEGFLLGVEDGCGT